MITSFYLKQFKIYLFYLKEIFLNRANFTNFYLGYNKEYLPKDLKNIIDKFLNSDSKKMISGWWSYNNIKDIKSLTQKGIQNYGEIFLHYYTWYDWVDEEISGLLNNLKNDYIEEKVNIFKKHNGLSHNQSFRLNFLILSLYIYLKKRKEFSFLENLQDASFCENGHSYITIDDKNISFDKVNSLIELSEINSFNLLSNNMNILEIGAGSGRLADTICSNYSNIKYIICDIPLAIYISYFRIKKRFNNKKILLAIDCNSEEDIFNKINSNDIIFIFPHQLKLIKKTFFDLTIAISSLHEMSKDTIKYYMNIINTISKNLYFTVWEKTTIPFSLTNETLLANKNYFVNRDWTELASKKNYFPSNFIQKVYKIN
jgi:putative sugar O-methyltransferase